MNQQLFIQLLKNLTDADWQAITNGQCLCMVDDANLKVGLCNESNAIVLADKLDTSILSLKHEVLKNAGQILQDYYLVHPLSLKGFNRQMLGLVDQYGVSAFTSTDNHGASYTLFVEGGELIAESVDSPRHRYGVCFESDKPLTDSGLEAEFTKWLHSGGAYERYLSMNVCRYNC